MATPADLTVDAQHWLDSFAHGFAQRSGAGATVAQAFMPDGWLRDLLVFTWDVSALTGHSAIASHIDAGLARGTLSGPPSTFALDTRTHFAPAILEAGRGTPGALEIAFTFETPRGKCRGVARLLRAEDPNWSALSVFMMLDAFHGHEEIGPELGRYGGTGLPWEKVSAERRARVEADPYVLVGTSTPLQSAEPF